MATAKSARTCIGTVAVPSTGSVISRLPTRVRTRTKIRNWSR